MTKEQIDDLLKKAKEITPEQQKYLEASETTGNLGSVLPPSKWFQVGMQTALGNVRRLLEERS